MRSGAKEKGKKADFETQGQKKRAKTLILGDRGKRKGAKVLIFGRGAKIGIFRFSKIVVNNIRKRNLFSFFPYRKYLVAPRNFKTIIFEKFKNNLFSPLKAPKNAKFSRISKILLECRRMSG